MPDDLFDPFAIPGDKWQNARQQYQEAKYAKKLTGRENWDRQSKMEKRRQRTNRKRSRMEQLRDRAASKAFSRGPRGTEQVVYGADGSIYFYDPYVGSIYISEAPDGRGVGTTLDPSSRDQGAFEAVLADVESALGLNRAEKSNLLGEALEEQLVPFPSAVFPAVLRREAQAARVAANKETTGRGEAEASRREAAERALLARENRQEQQRGEKQTDSLRRAGRPKFGEPKY